MFTKRDRNEIREIRHARVRKKISGTPDMPRLSVYSTSRFSSSMMWLARPCAPLPPWKRTCRLS